MSRENLPELTPLLASISESTLSGIDLRHDDELCRQFYQIRDLRRDARAAERERMQNDDINILHAQEWRGIENQAIELLTQTSKDIEITCYLIEAWVRRDGFLGLQHGLELLNGLLKQYWPMLNPQPEDEDDEPDSQLVALKGLIGESDAGTLIMPILALPMTDPDFSPVFATWQHQQAKSNQNSDVLDKFDHAVLHSSTAFYTSLQMQINSCLNTYQELLETLTNICNVEQPGAFLRQALSQCLTLVESILENKQKPTLTNEIIAEHDHNTTATSSIQQRDQALAQLQIIADYFAEHEPHSPIASTLMQAIHWSGLSFAELAAELIPDPNALDLFNRVTGLPRTSTESLMQQPLQNGFGQQPIPPSLLNQEI